MKHLYIITLIALLVGCGQKEKAKQISNGLTIDSSLKYDYPKITVDTTESKPVLKYFKVIADITLTNGCKIKSATTFEGSEQAASFSEIKRVLAEWAKPNKIKSIVVTYLAEIDKSERLKYSDKFSCEQVDRSVYYDDFITDTSIVGHPLENVFIIGDGKAGRWGINFNTDTLNN